MTTSRAFLLPTVILLIAAAGCFMTCTEAQQFNETGEHGINVYKQYVRVHSWMSVPVDITYPTSGPGPFPLVLMFNGFVCEASWYTAIVNHVASWGYVVMQYTINTVAAPFVGDTTEVSYLQPLLDWLAVVSSSNSSSPLAGRVDFSRKAVVGHSHGGKLAALHYAWRDDVSAAVLLDPVDCSRHVIRPWSEYPRAAAALAGLNVTCPEPTIPPQPRSSKTAAIVGAGYSASCNPVDFNYRGFADSLAVGSWQFIVNKAGHMQFAHSAWDPLYLALSKLCGPSPHNITTSAVMSHAGTIAVTWLELHFRPGTQTASRLKFFWKVWLADRAADGSVSFRPVEAIEGQKPTVTATTVAATAATATVAATTATATVAATAATMPGKSRSDPDDFKR